MLAWLALTAAALAQAHLRPSRSTRAARSTTSSARPATAATWSARALVTFDLRKFPKDDAARFRGSVLKGKGAGMPAFQGRLGDADVDLLWAYVRGGP